MVKNGVDNIYISSVKTNSFFFDREKVFYMTLDNIAKNV